MPDVPLCRLPAHACMGSAPGLFFSLAIQICDLNDSTATFSVPSLPLFNLTHLSSHVCERSCHPLYCSPFTPPAHHSPQPLCICCFLVFFSPSHLSPFPISLLTFAPPTHPATRPIIGTASQPCAGSALLPPGSSVFHSHVSPSAPRPPSSFPALSLLHASHPPHPALPPPIRRAVLVSHTFPLGAHIKWWPACQTVLCNTRAPIPPHCWPV